MGDDSIVASTRRAADAYCQLIAACGGKRSEGKHFESTGTSKRRRAVFLERL